MELSVGIKTAALVLITVMVSAAAFIVVPRLFNDAGWLGFFSAPVILFGLLCVAVVVWVRFIKNNFPGN